MPLNVFRVCRNVKFLDFYDVVNDVIANCDKINQLV